ncbi:hypothetical protein FOL47_003412, partial [Perkinsus chesapeaki]
SVLKAVAQPVGKYVYVEEDGKYRLAFDVDQGGRVSISFVTPSGGFNDGSYPLIQQDKSTFGVNIFVGLNWYIRLVFMYARMLPTYSGVFPRLGDLTTFTFTSDNGLYVKLGGRRLLLHKETSTLPVGEFQYTLGEFPLVWFHISYNIHPNGELDTKFLCTDILAAPVSFNLTKSDKPEQNETYYLSPPDRVDELKGAINHVCPGFPFQPNDLTSIVFENESTILITLGGDLLRLRKGGSTPP